MSERPTQVKVGWHNYSIEWVGKKKWRSIPHDGDVGLICGVTMSSEGRIAIRLHHETGLASESTLRETLMHEIMHAAFHTSGLTHVIDDMGDDREEKVIAPLAGPILAVLRENPEVLAYLTACVD